MRPKINKVFAFQLWYIVVIYFSIVACAIGWFFYPSSPAKEAVPVYLCNVGSLFNIIVKFVIIVAPATYPVYALLPLHIAIL